ncbi:hypothetical protein [Bradyrhizobium sp. SHOUNA76]|uniref:hypothetical protein n=1 Tax=Bradyrhizobium sp. SHOUNA76 TaxID=2908927 RepID=UPI001FF421CD|nr:hypothetical protein [Bradyrhizobium sp. SHOUNA76]MCJ9700927.1 hypothetical protein [Bradyrhizobium sp. SHOUNA76]
MSLETGVDLVELTPQAIELANDIIDLASIGRTTRSSCEQCLQTIASSLIVSAQNGHSIGERRFRGIPDHLELGSCVPQLIPQRIAFSNEIIELVDQRGRYGNVARTGCANQCSLGVFRSAIETAHWHTTAPP